MAVELPLNEELAAQISKRSDELMAQQEQQVYLRTDRLFALLLLFEWIAGIVVALLVSPQTWAGRYGEVHLHVWMSIFLGGVIVGVPLALVLSRPGQVITRHAIGIGQMLYGALLIHLTGGRIETHFHVFGSLALLSFYRDWRVLVSSSVVVAADHVLRGIFLPESVYGINIVQPWRWVEHVWWVLFEDAFLIRACIWQVAEMRSIANRQAEVEETRARVEDLVDQRTAQLTASERRLAEQFAEKEQLANIVQASSEPIIGQSAVGYILSWNKGAERVFGYKAEEAVFQSMSMLIPPDKQHEVDEFVEAAKNNKVIDGYETTRLRKDGSVVTVLITRSPILDPNKKVIGISELMHDITERKAAERRVSEFYSMVSHELRTPLTSIRGALGLIESGVVDPEESADLIQVARGSADRLIRLINDMLDLKKIESGKMELHETRFDAEDIVTEVIYSLRGMAQEGQIQLVPKIIRSNMINADWDKITQVLTNLVSNAIKFSPPGEVLIIVEETDDKGTRFTVKDSGPGIAAGDMPKLFDKFQQLDSSDSRQKGGTGLGLAICKALVERHSGKIGVDSTVGEGSSFWFELPGYVEELLVGDTVTTGSST